MTMREPWNTPSTSTTEVTTVTKEKWVDGKLVEKTVDKTEKTTTTGRNHPPTYITYNTNSINQNDLTRRIGSVIEGSAKATRR